MNKNSLKYLIFVVVIFCFIAIPAIILSYSVYRFFQTNEEQIVYNLKSDMQRMACELRRNVYADKYFCRLFHDFWISIVKRTNSNIYNVVDFCNQIKKYYEDDIDFVVIDNNGKIQLNTKPELYNHSEEVWKNAFLYAVADNSYLPGNPYRGKEYKINDLKEILGSQVVGNSLNNIYDQAIYSFIWGDSSGKIRPSSVYTFKFGGFFVFASKELLSGVKHLRYNAFDYSAGKKIITGLYNINNISNSFCSSKTINNVENIKNMMISPEYISKDFIDADTYYICHRYLTKDNYIFVMIEKENTKTDLIMKAVFVFLIYFLLSFPIVKYFWNTIILKIPGNASIRLKLGFLFLFASGIPLLSLGVVSHEYELHRRIALIEEAKAWSVENILGIEQRYQAYLKKICNYFDDYIDKWSLNLKNKELTNDYSMVLWKKLSSKGAFDYYCIGSETHFVACPEGFFRYSGSLDSISLI